MAKTKIIRGKLVLKENSLTESLTNRILSIDPVSGEITDRPAISASSFISSSLTSAQILVGNGSNVATAVAMSGVIAISNAGVTSIVDGSIVNADINGSAAIAYSKLNLASGIVNADVSGSAAIAYSKLSLSVSVVNADIALAAAIARTKIASGTAYRIIANNSSGVMSENAALTPSMGVVVDANGQLISSTASAAQINYLSSLTGDVQSQLNNEIATRTVNAIIKTPTAGEDGFAIIWDDGAQEYTLGDPVVQGIPVGGSTRQFLGKNTGTNYDASWLSLLVDDISDLTATVDDLNLLDGAQSAGVVPEDITNLVGTSSNVQDQIDSLLTIGANSWLKGGNTVGTNSSLGTNDAFSLSIKTNNTERIGISAAGLLTITSSVPGDVDAVTINATLTATANSQGLTAIDLQGITFTEGVFTGVTSSLILANAYRLSPNGSAYFGTPRFAAIGSATSSSFNNAGNNLRLEGRLNTTNDVAIQLTTQNSTSALTSGTMTMVGVGNGGFTFQPTTGTSIFRGLVLDYTINQTGSASGNVTGLLYTPTITSVLGTHYGSYWGSGLHRIGNHGTTVPTVPADGVIFYAEDVAASSELFVKDESGFVTQIS